MWKKPWYYATLNNYNRENVSPLKTNFCRTINVIIKIHLHIQAIYIHSHIVMRSIIIYSLAARMCKFWCVLTIGFLLINVSNGNQNKNFLSEEDKRGAINEIDSKSKRDLPIASGSSKRYYGDYDSNRYGGSGYPHTSGLGNYGDDRRPSTYYEDDYHHSGGGGYSRPSYGSGYGPPPVYHHGGGYEDDHYYNEHQGGEQGGILGNYKSLTLKKILLPLAGLAILGVAAAASHNPILLPLGTLNGRRRRSVRAPDIYPVNPHVRPYM